MRQATAHDATTEREQGGGSRQSHDPRAVRTREAILGAVDELITAGVATPSVSEVVRRAGISRSSFYTQFSSLEDLTSAVFSDALQRALTVQAVTWGSDARSGWEATRRATTQLVEHVAAHRGLYRLGLPSASSAYQSGVATVARQLEAGACVVAAPANGLSVRAAAVYLAGGMLALLNAWVTDELTADTDRITAHLMAMLPAWLMAPPAPQTTSRD